MRLFAILLFAAISASAQIAIQIDLSGEWRYQEGDDTAWARPDFDDSAWSRAKLWRPTRDTFLDSSTKAGWFRKRIDIPAEAAGRQLEVTLGTFAYEYEVWWNGERIGQTPAKAPPPRPRTFAIPADLTPAGAPALIAVRALASTHRGPFPTRISALPDNGPYLVTDASVTPREAVQLGRLLRERLVATGFVTGVLRVLLGLMLFIAWLTATQRRDLLALTALLICDSGTRLLESFAIVQDLPGEAFRVTGFLSFVSSSLLAWFALEVFGIRSRLLLVIWFPALYRLIGPTRGLANGTDWIEGWPKAVLEIGLAILALTVAWKKFRWQGWRSGPAWIAASIAVIAFLESQRIGSLTFLNVYQQAGGYLFHTYDVAVSLLASGMTLYLLLALGADRREKERLASEMEAGRTIQQLMLAAPPSTASWRAEAVYRPALEVGGDFHWTRVTADGALLLAVGDVSGKGLKAAMLVSVTIGILRNEKSQSPAAILNALNEGLAGHTAGGFVTCCCARFDPDGTVTIANAGHPSPYADGRESALEAGIPLGIDAGVAYRECIIRAERFTFVSDGVFEAENARRELFGFERTSAISGKPALEIAKAAEAWGQTDDITVLTVQRSTAAA